MKCKQTLIASTLVLGLVFSISVKAKTAATPETLVISPTVFDFGWSPDNTKIEAGFTVKNTGTDLVPLISLQPSCGCTAPQFTPADLSSSDVKKIGLTFNTRGYTGINFTKTAKLKAGQPEGEYTVTMMGTVMDPKALVVPVGTGIADFSSDSKEDKKSIEIQNKSDKNVVLTVIHEPTEWAQMKLESNKIPAGKSTHLEVTVKGPYDDEKNTSTTLEAVEESTMTVAHRLTIAIQTGAGPRPYGKIRAPEAAPESTAPPKTPNKETTP